MEGGLEGRRGGAVVVRLVSTVVGVVGWGRMGTLSETAYGAVATRWSSVNKRVAMMASRAQFVEPLRARCRGGRVENACGETCKLKPALFCLGGGVCCPSNAGGTLGLIDTWHSTCNCQVKYR